MRSQQSGWLLHVRFFLLSSRGANRRPFVSDLFKAEMSRNVRVFFAIELDIWVHEVIQGITVLLGRKGDVAADRELHAIIIPMSEEELPLLRMLPCFGDVYGYPSMVSCVEVCPAMIAGDVSVVLVCWNREANLKSRGNILRAHH